MGNERLLPRAGMLLMMVAGIMALVMPLTAMGRMDMVTICHVVGPPGAEQHITLVVAAPAVFGPAGHFNDNGTPRAGHEGDYLGPCIEDEDHTDTDTENTSNEEQETTDTGDHHHHDPDTDENDVLTSTIETTPTDSDDESGGEESDSNDESVTVDSAVEEAADDDHPGSGNDSDPVTSDEAVAAVVSDSGRVGGDTTRAAVETLPFTGPSTGLILPAVLMVIAGAMVVFGTTGPVPDAGAHVAAGRHLLGLRLRRGRHEFVGR
jgi:hypothetical protein